ncbi:MAG: isoprenylcysteine carboxylmethyltransferase family protein [Candidatus Lokiarchaeota archaeon]|nr:isoprenylcysteine carboxylmethyltransferase family protein [Candidatus Lokiarchaeota archaeon]
MSEKNTDPNPVIRFILMYIILALALFIPAGTILWLQGGIYIIMMIVFSTSFIIYLKKKDPELLKARAKTKTTESWDKKIGIIAGVFFLAMYILPGFDAVRFHWSSVPLLINMIGFAGMILAVIFFLLVSRENTYLSRVVEIQDERGHKVITTGPYKIVRHPMYLAVIVLYLCHCLALGSLYSLIPCTGLIITIIFRIYYEDKKLHEELEGYKEYAEKTRFKLIPGIW